MQRLSVCIDIDGTLTDPYYYFGFSLNNESGIRSGVQDTINELYQTHYIHFVTARNEVMECASVNWLHRNEIPYDSISLLGTPDKVQRAGELEADIFVEDCYDSALQLARAGFDVLLLDCGYNQGPLLPNVTRVYNWRQIRDIIVRHAEKEAS